MKRFKIGILAIGLAIFLAGSAQADPLTGSFGITGNFVPIGGNLPNATAIDFINCNGPACVPPPSGALPTPGVNGQFLVTSATGNFGAGAGNLGLLNQIGSIKDFTFSGAGSANYPAVPVSAFEVVTGTGTLTFDLSTVSIVQQNANCGTGGAGHGCIQLSGTGTFHATGFDDTAGNWSFFGQQACQITPPCANPPFIETFVFTSNNTIPPPGVPEPSLLFLIGVGLVGLAAWGRVRTRNTK